LMIFALSIYLIFNIPEDSTNLVRYGNLHHLSPNSDEAYHPRTTVDTQIAKVRLICPCSPEWQSILHVQIHKATVQK
jgi:hypothetical protein